MNGNKEKGPLEKTLERYDFDEVDVIPSKKLTTEALQHLNVTSNLLYSTRMTNWTTTMQDENGVPLKVGEVLMRLKSRVVQGLGVPDK